MTATPEQLLAELIRRCHEGLVSQSVAARLLTMRKADFAALAHGYLVLRVIEHYERPEMIGHACDHFRAVKWAMLRETFAVTFPETDPRCVRTDRPDYTTDPLFRPRPKFRTEIGNDSESRGKIEVRSIAPREPRALHRDTGQHPFDDDALDADDDEFDFIEAA